MRLKHDSGVTLAIVPSSRGFGYIVFENPDVPMDWGVKDVRLNKKRDSLLKARVLMHSKRFPAPTFRGATREAMMPA